MTAPELQLGQIVFAATPRLSSISEADASRPRSQGKWSRKEIVGHLIDSASNNHQRLVRAALQTSLEFPRYEQDGFVRVQAVEEANWTLLVSLWADYNRYLAHVIAHLPASKLQNLCRIGSNEPVTLEFLAEDYLKHLLHHLRQIGATS